MQADQSNFIYLRSPAGDYLARTSEGWGFVSESSQAHVFDYLADQIPEQLEAVHRELGLVLIAWPCDSTLLRETCDACGATMFPTSATFDGTRFLCQACRRSSNS